MINYWFPTAIFHSDYPDHEELKNIVLSNIQIKDIEKNQTFKTWGFWEKNVSRGLQDIFSIKNEKINLFKIWVENQVNEFSKNYGCLNTYSINQSWINVYQKGDFQESHIHVGFDFSGIYFLQSPKDSSNVIFENPLNIYNMKPLTVKNPTDLYAESAIYESVEGKLLLFRSNLRHGVFPHQSKENRITLAFNFLETVAQK